MHSSRMRTGRSLTVCAGGGGVPPSGGTPWQGCLLAEGGLLDRGSPWQGGSLRQTPPVNRMTDRCKNITLATTSLRPVNIASHGNFAFDRLPTLPV